MRTTIVACDDCHETIEPATAAVPITYNTKSGRAEQLDLHPACAALRVPLRKPSGYRVYSVQVWRSEDDAALP